MPVATCGILGGMCADHPRARHVRGVARFAGMGLALVTQIAQCATDIGAGHAVSGVPSRHHDRNSGCRRTETVEGVGEASLADVRQITTVTACKRAAGRALGCSLVRGGSAPDQADQSRRQIAVRRADRLCGC